MKNKQKSDEWFNEAAKYSNTYYGQLAFLEIDPKHWESVHSWVPETLEIHILFERKSESDHFQKLYFLEIE